MNKQNGLSITLETDAFRLWVKFGIYKFGFSGGDVVATDGKFYKFGFGIGTGNLTIYSTP